MALLDRIRSLADAAHGEVVQLRRKIHANPELAFAEHETGNLVAATLEKLGADVRRNVARTGIVAELRGKASGPCIALRADMDALPIHEATGLDFASRNDGRMHACGHDFHTSSLLGTAMVLSELREQLSGTVRFLFQPSEEKLPGGAPSMIEEGALGENDSSPAPREIFGQHVQPGMTTGTIGIRSGMYMASSDEIYITVEGEGGHAAAPHLVSADATYVAAQIVVSLQSIVSRHAPPGVPSVLTIGRLQADGATNVIPRLVRMEGTFRAMDEEWRFKAHELIRRTAQGTASALGATAEVEVRVGYPALYNHPGPAAVVRQLATEYVGTDRVVDMDQWYASEDFAFYLEHTPGAFYRVGTGDSPLGGLHTPYLMLDEDALRTSVGFMAYLAVNAVNRKETSDTS